MQIYVVREGDNIDKIAAAFGAGAEEIAYDNQISAPYPLAVGQALLIPGADSARQRREVRVNGYAYPYIQGQVLFETLSYLTNLSVFSYGFTTSGNLVPPQADDSWMIGEAWSQGTAPVLVLTPFDQTGMFNNYLISEITHNMTAQQNLIDQMFLVMEEKGFAGIDLDFEYILPQDRVAYADFVANVRAQAAPKGYFVSVALAPKTSADQKGLLYEGPTLVGQTPRRGGGQCAADDLRVGVHLWSAHGGGADQQSAGGRGVRSDRDTGGKDRSRDPQLRI